MPTAIPCIPPTDEVLESHDWILEIMTSLGRGDTNHFSNIESIGELMAKEFPIFKPLLEVSPPAYFRDHGQKIPRNRIDTADGQLCWLTLACMNQNRRITRITFIFFHGRLPEYPTCCSYAKVLAPGWNSCQAVNKFQSEIDGPLVGGYQVSA